MAKPTHVLVVEDEPALADLLKYNLEKEGYRVVGLGHHQTTFLALEIALGPSVLPFSAYFEQCRRQRNQVDYDMANVATKGRRVPYHSKGRRLSEAS